ncbi:MAG: DUF1565 domain-containing protein [Synechococcales cyanobacterium M58_A2018_015]|nr:DUF1565 domain-containing protein [Synechococcales cyanobacterium M58_A2018_015]
MVVLNVKVFVLAAGTGCLSTLLAGWEKPIAALPMSLAEWSADALAQLPSTAQAQTQTQTQPIVFVDPRTGRDQPTGGTESAPFRTLTYALEMAQPQTVIRLAPGTYRRETGERFPILMKADVTIEGDPEALGQGVLLQGGGEWHETPGAPARHVALVGADRSILTGITVTNPEGYGLWLEDSSPTVQRNTFSGNGQAGIAIAGRSAATLQGNLFMLNAQQGVTVSGDARPQIRQNIFQRTGVGIAVQGQAAPHLLNNRISQNRTGIVVEEQSQPLLRGNRIEDSEQDGLRVVAQAQPDLGTTSEPGENQFSHNAQHDINAAAAARSILAIGNQLNPQQIAGQVDLTGMPLGQDRAAQPSDTLPDRGSGLSSRAARRPAVAVPQSLLISTLPPSRPSPSLEAVHTSVKAAGEITVLPPSRRSESSPTASSSVAISTLPPVQSSLASEPPQVSPAATERSTSASALSSAQGETRTAVRLLRAARATATNRSAIATPVAARVTPPAAAVTPAAIEIPVPPPERSSVSRQTAPPTSASPQQPSSVARASNPDTRPTAQPLVSVVVHSSQGLPRSEGLVAYQSVPTLGGVPIPVPPPAAAAAPSPPPVPPPTAPAQETSDPARAEILPVPSGDIPLGNTGNLPRIEIAGGTARGIALASYRANVRYRVVVAASTEEERLLVRSLMPDAFATSANGQSVMQIGAFSNADNAQEAVELCQQNGLRAEIQPIE